MEEGHTSDLGNPQYDTTEVTDFHEVMEELRAAFPEPGAVPDNPDVLRLYRFSENGCHPGDPHLLVEVG